jgi:hypothetical protein
MMIGGLLSVFVFGWFYHTATQLRVNPFQWAIGALIVFYLVRYGWTYALLKPLMGAHFTNHSMATGVVIEISGALLGVAAAAWFRSAVLLKQHAPIA